MNPLLLFKLILRRFRLINSFCKVCGRDVHDFVVEDKLWALIEPDIKHGNTLCYDCFNELLNKKGIWITWKLGDMDDNQR
jgi:hypothetical protein